MSKKAKSKKDKVKIYFVGNNATEVTGSMTLVKYDNDKSLLVDCGSVQTNNIKQDFIANSKLPKEIKPKNVAFAICTHSHQDHLGNLPLLVRNGFSGRIFVPSGSRQILKKMLIDGAYIIARNARTLEREPYYNEDDVWATLALIEELPFNQVVEIDNGLSVELLHAGHILNSSQVLLRVGENGSTKKILFTGDIGNIKQEPTWCEKFQPCEHAHIVVGETTYGSKVKIGRSGKREKDREKMRSIIDSTVLQGGKVLIPSFSLSRTQVILEELWQLYNEEDIYFKVIIDSPLSVALTTLYVELLDGEKKDKLEKILKWDNLILSSDHKTHEKLLLHGRPLVVIASAGMLDFGRSNSWLKRLIAGKSNHILFVGYASPTTIAGKIKSGEQKSIRIDGKQYKNKCGITMLNSFSSHMQYDDLMDYYSSMGAETVYLVHGNQSEKIEFAKELQDKIESKNESTRVVAVAKGTVANI